MTTVLEECTTEEQRSAVRFSCGQNDSVQGIFIKKYFLFTVGSVRRVTASVVWWSEFLATDPEVPGSIHGATRFSEK
jgi:hypothetical protein